MKRMTRIAIAVAVLCTAISANAATYTKTDAAGNWADTAQWTPSGYPNSSADIALFSGFTADRTTSVGPAPTAAVVRVESGAYRTTLQGTAAAGERKLVMQSDAGNPQIVLANGPNYGLLLNYQNSFSIQPLQALELIVSQQNMRISADFVGTADIHCYTPGGFVDFYEAGGNGCDSPYFYGSVYCYGPGNYVQYQPNDLTNAAKFVLVDSAQLRIDADVTTFAVPLLVSNGVLYCARTAGGTVTFTTNITLAGVLTNSTSTSGLDMRYAGDIRGNGTIVPSNNGTVNRTNTYTGTISPGWSAGKITLNELGTSFRFYLGTSTDPLLLNMEVLSNGGVAGTDYDQVELLNMAESIDLANIEVNFTALTATTETNWFLKSNSQLINDFSNVAGTNDKYIVFFGKSTDGLSYGVHVIPEPGLLLGLLALLPLLRRR